MRFATSWMIVLLLAVTSVASPEDSDTVSSEKPEQTTENDPPTPFVSNNKSSSINSGITNRIRSAKLRENDDNDVAPVSDVIMDELLFFESLINGEKFVDENRKKSVPTKENKNEKPNKIDNSENPVESKVHTDSIDIRRQGEQKQQIKPGKSGPDIQYDDSKEEVQRDSLPRFGLRRARQGEQDETPVLQLTQGGYSRPFRQPRFRNRYISRSDSSEQSTQVQEPDRNTNANRTPETRTVPQVTYSSPPQRTFGPRPIQSPPFEVPRNMLAIHHVVPTTIQSPFFNTPPTGITEFTTVPFQAQFPQGNEVGGFPNFVRDSNNAAFYQVSQRNPFQAPAAIFQSAPEVQTQPMLAADTARNLPPQFQTNPFTPYPGFENVEDNSRPNYAMYFRNPTANNQFQVPPNFYATAPNPVNTFNSPPISFLSNYPGSDDRLSSRFFRHPVTTEAHNNRQSSNDQQLDSDASHEDKKADEQEAVTPTSRDDTPTASFGDRLQAQNEADVYMRYPTNEAGYAIEENLPSQNNSEVKASDQEPNLGQRNFPTDDPFRNGLNSIYTNQRINNSYEFPPEIFRNVPLDFGYHRPQSQIFLQYPERNREVPRYPGPNFGPRGPFDPIASLPENNYQFLNVDNQRQRQRHRETDGTPSCAKQNNASTCFEDSEYPRNDILYSLNSNSFLADRLSGAETPLNSDVFVERNATGFDQASESYACAVETKYGFPLRAKNLEGAWRIIVNIQDKLSQPVRMEVCKSLGDPCSFVDSKTKTTCVQKYSLQRLLSWNPGKGIYSDVYRIPVACSCQILNAVEA